jgi:multidrug efflux system membrane fusion protein
MNIPSLRPLRRRWLGAAAALAIVAAGTAAVVIPTSSPQSNTSNAAAPAPTPVSVAVVEQREITRWDEFSGRLEAVERVEIRPRVAGAVHAVHFREGALVKAGDLLVTIDPDPYAAEVERTRAQVVAADARLALAKREHERAQQLQQANAGAISQSNVDQRAGAYHEAEGNLRAAQAALQSAELNLGYTQVRAPVSGRVGKLEVTVGNLVSAGPTAPMLTTLVSVDPIYAIFNADENVVMRALKSLGNGTEAYGQLARIPVRMVTGTSNGTTFEGRLQLIDNQVDARSGTVRVRAEFDNGDGSLMPGQFARLRMGQAQTEPALVVNERAIGTDQNKRYVMVVDTDNKAAYREVSLGVFVDGLRVVSNGLRPGERIIVNGLQRVRPGSVVAPQLVSMTSGQQQASKGSPDVAQR